MSIVNQEAVKGKIIAATKGTKNMEKEAGLTYNEYWISKAIQTQDGFVKKGFFKIEYLFGQKGREKVECVSEGGAAPLLLPPPSLGKGWGIKGDGFVRGGGWATVNCQLLTVN